MDEDGKSDAAEASAAAALLVGVAHARNPAAFHRPRSSRQPIDSIPCTCGADAGGGGLVGHTLVTVPVEAHKADCNRRRAWKRRLARDAKNAGAAPVPAAAAADPGDVSAAARALVSRREYTPEFLEQMRGNMWGAGRPGRPKKRIEDIECSCGAGDLVAPLSHATTCARYQTVYQRERRARKRGASVGGETEV